MSEEKTYKSVEEMDQDLLEALGETDPVHLRALCVQAGTSDEGKALEAAMGDDRIPEHFRILPVRHKILKDVDLNAADMDQTPVPPEDFRPAEQSEYAWIPMGHLTPGMTFYDGSSIHAHPGQARTVATVGTVTHIQDTYKTIQQDPAWGLGMGARWVKMVVWSDTEGNSYQAEPYIPVICDRSALERIRESLPPTRAAKIPWVIQEVMGEPGRIPYKGES